MCGDLETENSARRGAAMASALSLLCDAATTSSPKPELSSPTVDMATQTEPTIEASNFSYVKSETVRKEHSDFIRFESTNPNTVAGLTVPNTCGSWLRNVRKHLLLRSRQDVHKGCRVIVSGGVRGDRTARLEPQ